MMKRTAFETALLVGWLLKKGGTPRARVSESTIRKLSKRRHLRSAFIEELRRTLDDLGVLFVEIDRGGFGVQRHTALNGAPALTAKRYLLDDLGKLDKGELDFEDIEKELEDETPDEPEE